MQDQLYAIDSNNDVILYDLSDIKNISCKNFEEEKFDFTQLFKDMDIDTNLDDKMRGKNLTDNEIDSKPKSINDIKINNKGKLEFDGNKITQISAGLNHILFLTKSGLVFA